MTLKGTLLGLGLLTMLLLGCGDSKPEYDEQPEYDELRINGPAVSNDGSKIAFVEQKRGVTTLCILDLPAGDVERVEGLPGFWVEALLGMSWSVHDDFIVLTLIEGRRADPGPFSIWRVNIPGGQAERIGSQEGALYLRPLISPDGRYVLTCDNHRRDLVLIDLETNVHKYLTYSGDTYRLGYVWSISDSRIYFSRGYDSQRGSIWIMDADGQGRTLVWDNVQGRIIALSHRGEYLAFQVSGSKETDFRSSLFVSSLPEYDPVKICEDSGAFFQWSPDKNVLAFECSDGIRLWDHPNRKVLGQIENGSYPVWARHGLAVFFIRNDKELWRYDARSGKEEHILSLVDEKATAGP